VTAGNASTSSVGPWGPICQQRGNKELLLFAQSRCLMDEVYRTRDDARAHAFDTVCASTICGDGTPIWIILPLLRNKEQANMV
jgi:hypothetical protein